MNTQTIRAGPQLVDGVGRLACNHAFCFPCIRAWAGVSSDTPLAEMYGMVRTLRIADGPDEVHNRTVARLEYAKHGGRGG